MQDCVSYWDRRDATRQAALFPGVARNGTTEIGHVNGLLGVFDALRLRHPSLVIGKDLDTCP